ncbi:MAG TPA: hypothetical protein VKT78_12005 [Fimbriimonadaceae bacterium]|nr:hypothetical protein [Fimbriimonadaceae bacterium]
MLGQKIGDAVDDPEAAPALRANQQLSSELQRRPLRVEWACEDFEELRVYAFTTAS